MNTQTWQDYRVFLGAALRQPAMIGAVAPSSPALAGCLASVVPSTGEPVVVELGPGTGAVSTVIQRKLPADARHLAIELDQGLADRLRRTHQTMDVIAGDARNLVDLLAARGVGGVDAVISGLPWALVAPQDQRRILDQVGDVLGPNGAFTTFAYVHARGMAAARRFHQLLHSRFDEVIVSQTVWRNLPPAKVYFCRRPVRRV